MAMVLKFKKKTIELFSHSQLPGVHRPADGFEMSRCI